MWALRRGLAARAAVRPRWGTAQHEDRTRGNLRTVPSPHLSPRNLVIDSCRDLVRNTNPLPKTPSIIPVPTPYTLPAQRREDLPRQTHPAHAPNPPPPPRAPHSPTPVCKTTFHSIEFLIFTQPMTYAKTERSESAVRAPRLSLTRFTVKSIILTKSLDKAQCKKQTNAKYA